MQTYPQPQTFPQPNTAPIAGPAAAPATGYGAYEFNENENGVLQSLSSRVKIWGIIAIAIGALYTLGGCFFFVRPALISYLFTGIVQIVIGATFVGAGSSLSKVVATQGSDIAHLMEGAKKLSRAFTIQIVMAIIGFVLVCLAVLLAIVLAVAAGASGAH
jgi:hypothetical protein